MGTYFFRCYSIKDEFWLFYDLELQSADFPDYLKMIQINDPSRYVISMRTGAPDRNGVMIYEKDFVRYKDSIYRVIQDVPGFVFECINGALSDVIDPDYCEVIGNEYENKDIAALQLIGFTIHPKN